MSGGSTGRPERIRAIGLLSGGLDSTLAARVLLEQGIEVIGLHYSTGFCMNDHRRAMARPEEDPKRMRNEGLRAGADLGIPIEVLGQRPMSQHMQALRMIEKECGIEGYLLRPLSAKHLSPTQPEELGWVDREKLLGITGRSRKEQMAWSETWGISDYPQPAGGCCYLADENFARRFHDKKLHTNPEQIRRDEMILLKVGRHFRLSPRVKIIVARDQSENQFLSRFDLPGWRFEALDCGSPLTVVEGEPDPDLMVLIASITARYSDRRSEPLVEVAARKDGREERLLVPPVADQVLERYRL